RRKHLVRDGRVQPGREQSSAGANHHRPSSRTVDPADGLVDTQRLDQSELQAAEASRNPKPEQLQLDEFLKNGLRQAGLPIIALKLLSDLHRQSVMSGEDGFQ